MRKSQKKSAIKSDIIVKVPVSIGELFDKITILDIKSDKISDETKLNNIKKELFLLEKSAEKLKPNFRKDYHFKKLYKINNFLWEVEDAKRAHEKSKDFGEKFIYWAREVYLNNDERAKIKKAINLKFGSAIVEEKSHK